VSVVSELEVLVNGNIGDLKSKLGDADREVQGFASRTASRAAGIAASVGAIGIGAAAAIAGFSLKASIAFESQFAEVRKTVDATDEQFSQLQATIRDMATNTENPLSSLENAHEILTGIMAMGGALGIATKDLATFTETVGMMTVATNLGAEEAANFLARFANVTGIDPSQFRDVGNAIVELGNNMAASETEIAHFAERIAPLATYDFSAADILGYAAALASLGVSAELGGTNLMKTVGAITEAVATGEDLDKFAAAAGMTATEFKNLNENDPSASLMAFVEGLSGMDASEQIITLKNLGITSQEQISLLQRMAAGYETVEQGLGLANSAFVDSNALLEEAAAKADTTAGKLNLFRNVLRNIGITLGDQIKPQFNDFLDVLIKAGIGLNKLLTGDITVGDFAGKIQAELSGALQSVLSGLGLDIDLGSITSSISSAFAGLSVDFSNVTSTVGGALAIALNAVQVGADTISTFGTTTWSSISSALDAATVDFSGITTTINDALTAALNAVGVSPEAISTFGTTTWSSISSALEGANVDFSAVTTTVGDALGLAISDVQGTTVDTSGITTFAETHFTDIVGLVGIAAGVIFGGPIGLAMGAGKLLASAIESDFMGIGTFLDTSGISAEVERVVGEIKATVEGIFESVFSGGGGGAQNGVSLGPQIVPGLEIGDYAPQADAMGRFAERLQTGVGVLKEALGGIGADLGTGLTDLLSGIKGFLDSFKDTDTEGLLDVATAIGGAIGAVVLAATQIGATVIGATFSAIGAALPGLGAALSDFISAISLIGKGDPGGALKKVFDGLEDVSGSISTFPASLADTVISKIEGMAGVELPNVETGMGAWVGIFENAWQSLGLIVDKIKNGIRDFVFDVKLKIVEFVAGLRETILSMTLGAVDIAPTIEMTKVTMVFDKLNEDTAEKITRLLQDQVNSGSIDLALDTLTIDLPNGRTATDSLMGWLLDPTVIDQMGEDGKQAITDALSLAISTIDPTTIPSIFSLLGAADTAGIDMTQFQAQFAAMLPEIVAGMGEAGIEPGQFIDIANMIGLDQAELRTKVQELLNQLVDPTLSPGEQAAEFSAFIPVVTELGMDGIDMHGQMVESVTAAAAMTIPTVTMTVDIVVVPNSIDTSGIAAGAAGAATGGGVQGSTPYWDPTVTGGGVKGSTPGSVPGFHSGGEFYSPRGEGFAFLRSGETVRTETQERSLAGSRGAGGGNTYVINSYGQNPYGVKRMVDRATRDRGA
jgi:TP901 family phage tail tape measure protein